jgi:hypothetical protein
MVNLEDDRVRYIVHYGDTSSVVVARTEVEALEIICNEYEAQWGAGAFDQCEVEVKAEDTDESAY